MLPVLFKLDFGSPAMQAFYLLFAVLLTGYGAWAGWRGAESRATAPWRAFPYATATALLATVAAVFAFPPMSPALASGIRSAAWALTGLLAIAGGAYGYKLGKQERRPSGRNPTEQAATFAVLGAALGAVAIKFGLGGVMGRGLGLPLHTYGLLLATAFLVAIALASREAARAYPEKLRVDGKLVEAGSVMREQVVDLSFLILIAAIVGSRVLFIITKWDEYKHNLPSMFGITGGLVFYGGFIGAALVTWWFCKTRKIHFMRIADVLIPSVALGHAIGRLGCLAAGCCWGGIAKAGSHLAVRFPAAQNLPFGGFNTHSLAYQDQLTDHRWVDALGHITDHAVDGATQISTYAHAHGFTMPVYPTQLMESLGELTLFAALLILRRYKRFHGQLFATWLMGYAVLRSTIEFFRGDLLRGYLFRYPEVDPLVLSTSQTISLGIFAAGVAVWVLYGRKAKVEGVAVAG